ncbi:hypothetical protein [Actinotalea solisilvae]|uniref:hypothetical protein n=1 Tax=Actinotalea solisilvae TaxID=2072922 RepID=UPI0018F2155C|nr:hypothetical protein [Actinotalea solisilvae]
MSEDVSTPIPDEPGQDPDAPLAEPVTDGYGLSGTPDSGYDLGSEAPAEGSSRETVAPGERQGDARTEPDAGATSGAVGPDGEPAEGGPVE